MTANWAREGGTAALDPAALGIFLENQGITVTRAISATRIGLGQSNLTS
ncbi:hypothetical protein OH802_21065 [Nocardioides sp. NBC_00850]|nr:hypothetical protein OH802_21065 [Nocardioides sp. NBC_00850]